MDSSNMDLDTVMTMSLDEYIYLKRIERPERAQKAKLQSSKFDRYRDAEDEESDEDDDELLVSAAANIKLENEEEVDAHDMEQMPPLIRISKPNNIWANLDQDETDANRVSVHKRIGDNWNGSQNGGGSRNGGGNRNHGGNRNGGGSQNGGNNRNGNNRNNNGGGIRKWFNNHNNSNGYNNFRNNRANPYKISIQDRLSKDYANANDMISKKLQEVMNVIQFNGKTVVDTFAKKLADKAHSIQDGRDVEKYDMTIQREISNIQNKPMFFKCPGGAVVSQDGPGIKDKIQWQNSTGISLNQRFA